MCFNAKVHVFVKLTHILFQCDINERVVFQAAQLLKSHGLAVSNDFGFQISYGTLTAIDGTGRGIQLR